MSKELALCLLAGLCLAEIVLRALHAWDRAVSWLCPCEGHTN